MRKLAISILVAGISVASIAVAQADRSVMIAKQYGVATGLAANCPNLTLNESKVDAFLDAEGIHRVDRVEGAPFYQTVNEAIKSAGDMIRQSPAGKKNDSKGKQVFACKTLLEVVHRNDSVLKGFLDPK
ncbi:hypothetical protein G6L29_02935 [Agrobacterium rhizogenes]|nr:hypothetical protein [Rhizobium rhizogenes]NTG85097.1 hypothetical protein [Rhizobium rhizogenes]NTH17432.1 hypothetical protein [Rhizobium rhizogenes]NTH30405.1 hypothetical protein [Rhizobium rhizogenes]NTI14586.1 hypothetical protein [Rhizobium rhizogenes]